MSMFTYSALKVNPIDDEMKEIGCSGNKQMLHEMLIDSGLRYNREEDYYIRKLDDDFYFIIRESN